MANDKNRFYSLPNELQIIVYEYDNTYKLLFDKLMNEFRCVFYFLNRKVRFKPSSVNCRKVKTYS